MYRLSATSPSDSESQPSSWTVLASIGVVIALSLVGLVSILAIGYYLPAVGAKTYWFISRSSGLAAYVLITAGMLWGLVQSGDLFRTRISPLVAFGMHNFLSWLGLGFVALHGIILIGDEYINIDLPRVFTPFLAEYRPIPVGLGIISFYLLLLLTLSFYARSYMGHKSFRLLHYSSFAVFLMITLHGLFAGTDTSSLWLLYALSLVAVVAFTVLRIVRTTRTKKAAAAPGATVAIKTASARRPPGNPAYGLHSPRRQR